MAARHAAPPAFRCKDSPWPPASPPPLIEVTARPGQPLGMAPATFLRDFWQKRPLLIRNAFPNSRPRCSRKTWPGWPARKACWRA